VPGARTVFLFVGCSIFSIVARAARRRRRADGTLRGDGRGRLGAPHGAPREWLARQSEFYCARGFYSLELFCAGHRLGYLLYFFLVVLICWWFLLLLLLMLLCLPGQPQKGATSARVVHPEGSCRAPRSSRAAESGLGHRGELAEP
jgi:hypothetical protein